VEHGNAAGGVAAASMYALRMELTAAGLEKACIKSRLCRKCGIYWLKYPRVIKNPYLEEKILPDTEPVFKLWIVANRHLLRNI